MTLGCWAGHPASSSRTTYTTRTSWASVRHVEERGAICYGIAVLFSWAGRERYQLTTIPISLAMRSCADPDG